MFSNCNEMKLEIYNKENLGNSKYVEIKQYILSLPPCPITTINTSFISLWGPTSNKNGVHSRDLKKQHALQLRVL